MVLTRLPFCSIGTSLPKNTKVVFQSPLARKEFGKSAIIFSSNFRKWSSPVWSYLRTVKVDQTISCRRNCYVVTGNFIDSELFDHNGCSGRVSMYSTRILARSVNNDDATESHSTINLALASPNVDDSHGLAGGKFPPLRCTSCLHKASQSI